MFKKSVMLSVFCFMATSSFLFAQDISKLSQQELKDKKQAIMKQLNEITNDNIRQGTNKKQSSSEQQNAGKLVKELTEIQVLENSMGKQ